MQRATATALLCLGLVLVLLPAVLVKPGWPAGLKADEPAYFLMAMSLAEDGDLVCDLGDLRRLFDTFPYSPAANLILASGDNWQTVFFGKPIVYSFLAAPFVKLLGANGLITFNMVLLVAMIWMGTLHLRRFNSSPTAALFSSGYFLLSVGFAYAFWIHPEVLNMTGVTACLYFGLRDAEGETDDSAPRWRRLRPPPGWRGVLSAAALAVAVYNKPMLAALGVPVLIAYALRRRWRGAAVWTVAAVLSMGVLAGISTALVGKPTAYLGLARGGYKVCSANQMPILPGGIVPAIEARNAARAENDPPPSAPAPSGEPRAAETSAEAQLLAAGDDETIEIEKAEVEEEIEGQRRSWAWIFRIPPFHLPEVLEDVGYFLWGRHTGLFLYFPFSLLALGLFLAHARRSAARWTLLGALAVVALFFLLFIPFNWHGGGGFVGNRYFVNAYPGFLFLVTRIAPRAVTVVGYLLGGLLLAPTLFTPMGRAIPWPTLQAHVRNVPFDLFPLELTLQGIPGYHEMGWNGVRFVGRKDVFLPRGARFWTHGATETEIWLRSPEPLGEMLFKVESEAADNEIVLTLAGDAERVVFTAADAAGDRRRRVLLTPGPPDRVESIDRRTIYFYRLGVRSETGEITAWTKRYPPQECPDFPYMETTEEAFYVGAQLTYLGTPERFERDVYRVEWGRARAPEKVAAGELFEVDVRLRNTSDAVWPADPPVRVSLAYHWEDADGREIVRSGLRSQLEEPVPPGGRVRQMQSVQAPETPGDYVLVLDLIYEEVAWFSLKDGATLRLAMRVM